MNIFLVFLYNFMQYICISTFIAAVKNYAIRCTFDSLSKKVGNSANCFSFQIQKKIAKKKCKKNPPDNHQFNLELCFEIEKKVCSPKVQTFLTFPACF